MRLRPSGRSGPLATQIDGFRSYQEREAWTWEHMALTRARVVSAPPTFAATDRDDDPRRALPPRDPAEVAADVVEMRAAIAKEKGDADPWDLKYAAGASGRYRVHRAISATRSCRERCRTSSTPRRRGRWTRRRGSACSSPRMPRCCSPAVRLFHDLTQILRLCLPAAFDPKTASAGVLASPGARRRPAGFSRRSLPMSRKPSARCASVLCGFWEGAV